MTADSTAPHSTHPQPHATCVPEQGRRRALLPPTDRIRRQVAAIDAWIAARRARELALQDPGLNRDQRLDVAREIEALRRAHDAIKGRCARGLGAEPEPMSQPGPTAVIAHRHTWFGDKLASLLGEHGVTVLVCTDNGAEALGAVVAEQPDIVLVGDRLAMMSGSALLAGARLYAPGTLRAAQASGPDGADELRSAADSIFLRHHGPAFVADSLVALHLARSSKASTA